jgi:Holliday junction DNA helicase RuvA
MALTILSGINDQEFAQCVLQDDIVTLTRLPGVGKKTAERLIIEMRDKVEDLMGGASLDTETGTETAAAGRSSKKEAIEALQALGYKAADAEKMVRQAESGANQDMNAAALIRKALQASVSR